MVDDPTGVEPAVFEQVGPDRYRVRSGRERGELLEVVRGEGGEPVKLFWATHPCTRSLQTFGNSHGP